MYSIGMENDVLRKRDRLLFGVLLRAECFKRGMIVPGVVMLVAVLYQLGLVDAIL